MVGSRLSKISSMCKVTQTTEAFKNVESHDKGL